MSELDRMIQANGEYAGGFTHGDLASPPARHVAIVTCMDARMDPAKILGLSEGDAHVIRNAGGAAADALRSLIISQQLLGTTEVAVIKHTKCGMQGLTADKVEEACSQHGIDAPKIDWLGFADLEAAVREDIAFLTESPLIKADTIRGFVYDVTAGTVTEVQAPVAAA